MNNWKQNYQAWLNKAQEFRKLRQEARKARNTTSRVPIRRIGTISRPATSKRSTIDDCDFSIIDNSNYFSKRDVCDLVGINYINNWE